MQRGFIHEIIKILLSCGSLVDHAYSGFGQRDVCRFFIIEGLLQQFVYFGMPHSFGKGP